MGEAVFEYPAGLAIRKKRRQALFDPRWLPASLKMEIERLLISGLSVRQVVEETRSTIGSVARCRKRLIELGIAKPKLSKPKVQETRIALKVEPRNPHSRHVTPPTKQIVGSAFGPIPLTRLMAGR